MNCKIVENKNKKYIEVIKPITCESDVLDIIGTCISYGVYTLLLREKMFTDDFLNLKSGLAGIVLQKLTNYNIKVAAIIEDKDTLQGRVKELMNELNQSNDFRIFNTISEAEEWITK